MSIRLLLVLLVLSLAQRAFSQQDMEFHIGNHLLAGKKILKLKRDFQDPYLWVLAENDAVYRINSITFAIDDFTPVFSAYNNLQFNDIAGYSKDTVFVASNSTNVIAYYNGNISVINGANGLAGNVTSIGLGNDNYYGDGALLIGTTSGFGLYYVYTGALTYNRSQYYLGGPIEIFTATYRNTMHTWDDITYPPGYPIAFDNISTSYGSEIVHTAESGNKINTAFYVPRGIAIPTIFAGSSFWGNGTGLYQESLHFNNEDYTDFVHFLDGVNVTKIGDILGLTSFYQQYYPGITKDNLLVGTDSGLYFSNSMLDNFIGNEITSFTLFKDPNMGNTPIKDLCVNGTAKNYMETPTGCENGVWLATPDGVYLLNPDYGKFITPAEKLYAVYINNPLTDSVTNINLCAGSSITANIRQNVILNNAIQWKKDGKDLVGETGPQLRIADSGTYYAVLYNSCNNVHIQTNELKVTKLNSPVFTFNYPDKIQKCNNAPDTLQTEYNPGYHYRWYTNGVLNGDTTNVNIVTQSGRYKLEVSACTNSWVPSKEVELDMITLPLPTVSADKLIYCAEDTARLSVNIPADNAYDINWYRDGALLSQFKNAVQINTTTGGNYTAILTSTSSSCTQPSGAFNLAFVSSPSFTFNYPSNLTYCAGTPVSLTVNGKPGYRYRWYRDQSLTGDTLSVINIAASGTYKVEVSACEGSWVPANPVNVNLIELSVPAISLDKPAYCIGDNAKMTINISPDPSYTISWYRDNIPVAADQDQQSVITAIPGSYTVLLTSNTSNTDGSKCTQISGPQQLIFNPPPVISIREIVKTTICDGQTVGLQASYSGGTIKWSTRESSDQINVTSPGNYMATVTSAAGCVADTSINVRFLPDPVLNLKDTSLCTYTAQNITLVAPAGFSAYQWNNGVSAAQTFQVSSPQTLSLTVTDANGCQATQQITVSAQCPDVHIPNTFTPNGDGINDLWDIAGLEADHSALVKVYNRYGTLLYESKGYPTPWNGEMNGKKLPAGVYYYIVNAKNNKQKYSGSLTIIY
jgi:gliding motility-associated-like protein